MGSSRHARRWPRHLRRMVSNDSSGMVGDAAALRSRRVICLICFAHLPNPFAETIRNREQRGIHRLTLLVIGVFILMYFGLGYIPLASV
jgi:hypothetical protein